MVNYFELYDIPVSFTPDQEVVKRKYYELSRKYHPDRFTLAEGSEQAEALQMSSLNNDAFKTLKDPYKTIAYILKLNDMLEEEEKYNLPPDFLMEMMDLNEAISEYEMNPGDDTAQKEATAMMESEFDGWDEEMQPLIEKFSNGDTSKELLADIKDYYYRKKYLLRIKERMNGIS